MGPYGPPGERAGNWDIYREESLVARVKVPNGFRLTEIGEDWIIGVSTDSMRIECVQSRRVF
jgi:hypothetical protein